jgi:hypothetical protein
VGGGGVLGSLSAVLGQSWEQVVFVPGRAAA